MNYISIRNILMNVFKNDAIVNSIMQYNNIFTNLIMFTCSAIGKLSNVSLNEKIPLKNTNPTGRILKLVSNYYEQINPLFKEKKKVSYRRVYYYLDGKEEKEVPYEWLDACHGIKEKYDKKYKIFVNIFEKTQRKTLKKRGRKPKKKIKKNRAGVSKVGSFDSCITFWIKSSFKEGKIYFIKVFRNGRIQISGILHRDMSDAKCAIKPISKYLTDVMYDNINKNFNNDIITNIIIEYKQEEVELVELYSATRNYRFKLLDSDMRINLSAIYDLLTYMKDNNLYPENDIVTSVEYSPEKLGGLKLMFSTPIERNPKRTLKIKIFQSGKINFYGGISDESAEYHYNLLIDIFSSNKDIILYNLNLESSSESSSEE